MLPYRASGVLPIRVGALNEMPPQTPNSFQRFWIPSVVDWAPAAEVDEEELSDAWARTTSDKVRRSRHEKMA